MSTDMNDHSAQQNIGLKYPLNSIYFYLTEGCNLRCRHCWIAPKHQSGSHSYPALPLHLFKKIVAEGKPLGLSNVKLTGGEPLLHPKIFDILDTIRNENLCLGVETNGVLCTREMAEELAKCKLGTVSVSLDGIDAETHEWVRGVKGCFKETVAGLKNLVNAGIKPQVIMTIMRRNSGQISDMVKLAETLGAGSVKFNVVQPTARGEKMQAAGETLTIEELIGLGQWVDNTLAPTTNIKLYYTQPMAFRSLSSMFSCKGSGCGVCGILGIIGVLANGSYALCGIGENVPELIFGHASSDKLNDVWNNAPVIKELRNGLPSRLEGVCSKCAMNSICLGSCIAQNYYRNNNLWAPFWYCQEAMSSNKFPGSRLLGKL